jgi:hypothetical protein
LQDELRDKDQRLLSLQEQVTQYRRREQDLAQQYERQLQDILRRKEEELDSVEGQVRQTLSHRDDTINDLRAQLDEERIKNTQLTLILEKQRQELVGG